MPVIGSKMVPVQLTVMVPADGQHLLHAVHQPLVVVSAELYEHRTVLKLESKTLEGHRVERVLRDLKSRIGGHPQAVIKVREIHELID